MEISSNSTPLNIDKFKKNLMSIESGGKKNQVSFHISKSTVMLGIAVVAFIAGLSFWIFVNYML